MDLNTISFFVSLLALLVSIASVLWPLWQDRTKVGNKAKPEVQELIGVLPSGIRLWRSVRMTTDQGKTVR